MYICNKHIINMSDLFKNCTIDLQKGIVSSIKGSKHTKNKFGYCNCKLHDIYGNTYYCIHEIIVAEGLKLPKHLWPVDKNGKRYIVDHIIPVSNGGTDTFENLHLIPRSDNPRNELSRKNMSNALTGKHCPPNSGYKKGHTPWNKGKTYHTGKKWHHSEEAKKKMSEANKGKQKAAKKVYQYTIDGKLVNIYKPVSEAIKDGFLIVGISRCCHGKTKTYKGYRWSYEPL